MLLGLLLRVAKYKRSGNKKENNSKIIPIIIKAHIEQIKPKSFLHVSLIKYG